MSPQQQLNNRAEWVAALRSGAYKQTRYALARKSEAGELSFCCLGVAAEVAGCEASERYSEDPTHLEYLQNGEYSHTYNNAVWFSNRFGVSLPNTARMQRILSAANDSVTANCDFNKIADLVEHLFREADAGAIPNVSPTKYAFDWLEAQKAQTAQPNES